MLSAWRAVTTMLLQEFAERTGLETTQKYFNEVIHPEYMQSDFDKDAYCRQWIKQGGYQKAYDAICRERNEQKAIAEKYRRAYENSNVITDTSWTVIYRLPYKLAMLDAILNEQ